MEYLPIILVIALYIVPLWRICRRFGIQGPLSLIAAIPWFGLIVVAVVLSWSAARPGRAN